MAESNIGEQQITWKYSTPLKSKSLMTMLGGLSVQGLTSRPSFSVTISGESAVVTISKFGLLIEPEDIANTSLDEFGNPHLTRLVHINFESNSVIAIQKTTVAIGFRYTYTNESGDESANWYGEFIALNSDQVASFKGVIIATCFYYNDGAEHKYKVSTSGGDISTELLIREGWNPSCWLSLMSPRRMYANPESKIYALEIRKNNDAFNGYFNGYKGLYKKSSITLQSKNNQYYNTDLFGDGKVTVSIRLLGDGALEITDSSDTLPITNAKGGIIGVITKLGSFINELRIYPVVNENYTVYVSGTTLSIN